MRAIGLPMFLFFISILVCSVLYSGSIKPKLPFDKLQIRNLQVIDVPNDDGSGLQLVWEPLPKEARAISYRIYRGISPDTLFFIGEITVNPRIGIQSETMSFQDKDFSPFVNISSPGRLQLERGQPLGSPLYRGIPRDVKVLDSMIDKYTLLGIIPKDIFYYQSKPIAKDGIVYAGISPNQIRVVKKLIPGHKYYYTVAVVNEQRKFLPFSEIVCGVPEINYPEQPGVLHSVLIKDLNRLQFEWEHAVYSDDHIYNAIYLVEDNNAYQAWTINGYHEKPGIRIYLGESGLTNSVVKLEEGSILINHGEEIIKLSKPLSEYFFVLSYIDSSGNESFSNTYSLERELDSSYLPKIEPVTIVSRKDDKGDTFSLMWGKPFVRISSVSSLNDTGTKLHIGYEYTSNDLIKIKNIFFEFYDQSGILLTSYKAFFFNGTFNIRIPEKLFGEKLLVKMYFNTRENGIDQDHYMEQELIYDEMIMSLRPQKLKYGSIYINDFSYQILKRGRSSGRNRVSSTFPMFERQATDSVPYITSINKIISGYDLNRGLVLVDNSIDLVYDPSLQTLIRVPIFVSEINSFRQKIEKNIANARDSLSISLPEDIERWEFTLNNYLNQLKRDENLLSSNILYKQVSNNLLSNHARMKMIQKNREYELRENTYEIILSDGKGLFSQEPITVNSEGVPYYIIPEPKWFKTGNTLTLISSLIFGILVYFFIRVAKSGRDLYIRPIAGIEEIDNAIGRATEMGRPILFCPGLSGINDVATLAGLSILGKVAKKSAEYDTRILVPCRDYVVLPIAQEIVREAHSEAGRPDSFDRNNIFFVSSEQFAYVAGVNGVMIREKTATNFYMGMFYAESLIMTESGNACGAIQIAGTDAVTQIPFFITTCDYTLMGEELYAASAYMSRQPLTLGVIKAQDFTKFLILVLLIIGTVLSSLQITTIIDIFPDK